MVEILQKHLDDAKHARLGLVLWRLWHVVFGIVRIVFRHGVGGHFGFQMRQVLRQDDRAPIEGLSRRILESHHARTGRHVATRNANDSIRVGRCFGFALVRFSLVVVHDGPQQSHQGLHHSLFAVAIGIERFLDLLHVL